MAIYKSIYYFPFGLPGTSGSLTEMGDSLIPVFYQSEYITIKGYHRN